MSPPTPPIGTAAITENLLKRKWSAVILRHLQSGLRDPADIARLEPDLSSAAMLERLRTMLRYDLIDRLPRASPSAPVCYRLTPRGEKMLKMLRLIERIDEEPVDFDKSIDLHLATRSAAPAPASVSAPSSNNSSLAAPDYKSPASANLKRLRSNSA